MVHLPHHHQSSSTTTSSSNVSPKGQLYAQTLDQARRLQLFNVKYPALLKGGGINHQQQATRGAGGDVSNGMDWNELLRKFRKHNPQRNLTATSAQTEQIIYSLLAQQSHSNDTTLSPLNTSEKESSSSSSLPPLPPILSSQNRPTVLTALENLQNLITSSSSTSGNRVELESSKVVLAFGSYVCGQFESALRALEGVAIGDEGWNLGVMMEGYDYTLRVLANAVRGYSLERLGRSLEECRQCYKIASKSYQEAVDHLSLSSSKGGGGFVDVSLHKIGETVLFRLCSIDRLISSPHHAYTSHLLYVRQSHLQTDSKTSFPLSHSLQIHRYLRQLHRETGNNDDDSMIMNDLAQERILRRMTSLPRAGEVNGEYLRFLDEVVEGWREGGCGKERAKKVVEILYNALTHTFQSQRLLRYLVRTLTVCERYVEASKALDLHVELWNKARETDAKEVAREMKFLRKKAGVAEGGGRDREGTREWIKVDGEGEGEKSGITTANGSIQGDHQVENDVEGSSGEIEHDVDSDRQFIEIGAFGVRLLCRYINDPKKAVKLAERMKVIFQEKKDADIVGDRELEAKVELSLGIALGALAAKDANPELRPAQHASALSHLESASTLSPQDFHTLYHLAYQLFELRQISRGLEIARRAVSIDKSNKRGWHLLGLLVSAQKDMLGALQVFETALEVEEEVQDENDALAKLEGTATSSSARNNAKEKEDRWNYPTNETEKLAVEAQLRLSKNVVIEYLEGPAAALADQRDILAWFSSAYAPIHETLAPISPPPTTASTSSNVVNPSDGLHKRKSLIGRRVSLRSKPTRESSTVSNSTSHHLSPPPGLSPRTPGGSTAPSVAPTPRNGSIADLSLQDPTLTSTTTTTTTSSSSLLPSIETNPLATKLLVSIWLSSAASFRRAGKLEEAKGAVWEAERLNGDDPDVWSQLAQIYVAKGDVKLARSTLQKAFSFEIDHLPSLILFSRMYLTQPSSSINPEATQDSNWISRQIPFAESLLETLTKRSGWDSPEAWYELSRCYGFTERREKEKECLVWALQLEETKSLRSLDKSLERVL